MENKIQNSLLADSTLSHDDFVRGIKNGSLEIAFTIKDLDVYSLCSKNQKNILGIIINICFFLPLILIIALAIYYLNWWLLIGLPLWYLATVLTHFNIGYFLTSIAIFIVIYNWINIGFHLFHYSTFFPLVFIFSHLLTVIEMKYSKAVLIKLLVENPILFNESKEKIEIKIHR